MFLVTIAIGSTTWALAFNSHDNAVRAYQQARPLVMGGNVEIEDDYGQAFSGASTEIKGVLMEDMDKTALAHIERMVHATRTQIEAQKRAEADPKIRSARQMGPAVLTPGINSFRPQ